MALVRWYCVTDAHPVQRCSPLRHKPRRGSQNFAKDKKNIQAFTSVPSEVTFIGANRRGSRHVDEPHLVWSRGEGRVPIASMINRFTRDRHAGWVCDRDSDPTGMIIYRPALKPGDSLSLVAMTRRPDSMHDKSTPVFKRRQVTLQTRLLPSWRRSAFGRRDSRNWKRRPPRAAPNTN
jgi:hypothetical protein